MNEPLSPAHPEAEAAPPPALAAQLQALPPLPAPADVWQRVVQAAAARRVQRRRQVALALAAGVAVVLAAGALVYQPDAAPPSARPAEVAALPVPAQRPAAGRYAVRLPAAAGAEHLVRARIAGLDATLNRSLLEGEVASRPALLRQRAALMESLAHLEQHRQQAIVQAVY